MLECIDIPGIDCNNVELAPSFTFNSALIDGHLALNSHLLGMGVIELRQPLSTVDKGKILNLCLTRYTTMI